MHQCTPDAAPFIKPKVNLEADNSKQSSLVFLSDTFYSFSTHPPPSLSKMRSSCFRSKEESGGTLQRELVRVAFLKITTYTRADRRYFYSLPERTIFIWATRKKKTIFTLFKYRCQTILYDVLIDVGTLFTASWKRGLSIFTPLEKNTLCAKPGWQTFVHRINHERE